MTMTQRVVFLHTMHSVVVNFDELARLLLPAGMQVWHILDEMLAKIVVAQGHVTPFVYRRVAEHARAAEEAGANILQITCSSISPSASAVQPLVGIPVLAIDEPMVDRALGLGTCIGVAATAPTALALTSQLVRDRGQAIAKNVKIIPLLCEGAYARLLAGDMVDHDRIVRTNLESLYDRTDVIVVAQASMTRVAETVSSERPPVPILSAPRPAMERLRDRLAALRAGPASS